MPNEHVFQEQRISHPHTVCGIAFNISSADWAFAHVETNRDVQFFSECEIWLQGWVRGTYSIVLGAYLGKDCDLAFRNQSAQFRQRTVQGASLRVAPKLKRDSGNDAVRSCCAPHHHLL
jgi:hypothetical protein